MALKHYPAVEFSIHLHTNLTQWYEKVDEAYKAGCRHFDGVLNGLGGCPMAGHKMVGNLNTNLLLLYCEQNGIHHGLDTEAIRNANEHAARIFQIA
jgi:hydroxymethylglutaryl-CoA lyase